MVEDVKHYSLKEVPATEMYVPYAQKRDERSGRPIGAHCRPPVARPMRLARPKLVLWTGSSAR